MGGKTLVVGSVGLVIDGSGRVMVGNVVDGRGIEIVGLVMVESGIVVGTVVLGSGSVVSGSVVSVVVSTVVSVDSVVVDTVVVVVDVGVVVVVRLEVAGAAGSVVLTPSLKTATPPPDRCCSPSPDSLLPRVESVDGTISANSRSPLPCGSDRNVNSASITNPATNTLHSAMIECRSRLPRRYWPNLEFSITLYITQDSPESVRV